MGFFVKDAKPTPTGQMMERLLNEIKDKTVMVGYNGTSGTEEDGTSIAYIAAWNEFGTIHIPSRPFMRDTVKNRKDEITKKAQRALWAEFARGGSAESVLNKIGIITKSALQREIRDGEFVPNAPETIARKGSSKPLIDTGRMRQSIIYEIRKG